MSKLSSIADQAATYLVSLELPETVLAVDPPAPVGVTGVGAWVGAQLSAVGTEFWIIAAIAVPIGIGIFALFFLTSKGKRAVKG